MSAEQPRWRSTLLVAAHDDELVAAAAGSGADRVLLDLDDTVPPRDKERARGRLADALATLAARPHAVAVRVNAPADHRAHRDVLAALGDTAARVDAICVPKVRAPSDVTAVEWLIGQVEAACGRRQRTALELQIETAEAVARARAIAGACSRLRALSFGHGDFAASVRTPIPVGAAPAGGDARALVGRHGLLATLVAARAAGVVALDGPHPVDSDFAAHCELARSLGFDGAWCASEDQVEIANAAFVPRAEELERAHAILREHADAAPGRYDAAAVLMAEQAIARAGGRAPTDVTPRRTR